MNKQSIPTFLVGLIAGIFFATACFALFVAFNRIRTSNITTLKLAHGLSESDPVHLAMLQFRQSVAQKSKGAMNIDIYPNGILGNETQCLELLQQGQIAMTKSSAGPMESFIPSISVFSLPYIFKDQDHYWRVLNGPIGQELLASGKDKGLLGICYYDAGARSFYTNGKPILTPDDLSGMKIRVTKSPTAMKIITTLGGSPTPISWGDLYSALQQGMISGAENNLPAYYNNRHYEVTEHFSLDQHTRIPDVLMISTSAWNDLSQQQQAWIKQAAAESSLFQRDLWNKETTKAIAAIQEEGIKVHHPDQSLFRERVSPMYDHAMTTPAGPYLKRILETE